MNIFIDIVKFLFLVVIGIVGIYLFARLTSYAAAKSWLQAKRNEEEINNEKEKK